MSQLIERIKNEPVLLVTVLGALITVLLQLGVPISDDLANALTGLAWAVLALVARSKVSPVTPARGQAGQGDATLILLVAIFVGVVLLLFGVRF